MMGFWVTHSRPLPHHFEQVDSANEKENKESKQTKKEEKKEERPSHLDQLVPDGGDDDGVLSDTHMPLACMLPHLFVNKLTEHRESNKERRQALSP